MQVDSDEIPKKKKIILVEHGYIDSKSKADLGNCLLCDPTEVYGNPFSSKLRDKSGHTVDSEIPPGEVFALEFVRVEPVTGVY